VSTSPEPRAFPIWPGVAPGSESWTNNEQTTAGPLPYATLCVRNISRPTLTAYAPDPKRATRTAMIVCPGGAFTFLSIDKEGTDVAAWLTSLGVAAFVLKYRVLKSNPDDEAFAREFHESMTSGGHRAQFPSIVPLAVADGLQAVRVVRRRAAEWGVSPDRIGIMGFSAGGMVTVVAATAYDAESRPNFAAPIYAGALDRAAVPQDAPPLFIAAASDDPLVPVVNASLPLYAAWHAAGRPVEMHIYARGGHGFGMIRQGLPFDGWIDRLADWMRWLGMLPDGT